MNAVLYASENCVPRWVGYFDLLGTSELIRSGKTKEVFSAYQEALVQLSRWSKRHANVYHAWFSDTFLIYSEDDSGVSFPAIEIVCRWFAFALLRRKIAVRGALSCGAFYADRANSLYLGAAFLEAYEWGENQDWIGFILCPSSVNRLANLNLPVEELPNYVKCAVPFKKPPVQGSASVGACILGNMIRQSDGSNLLLPKLAEMAELQADPLIRQKYERTIEFLANHERKPAGDS
jgi:hypothetical protein